MLKKHRNEMLCFHANLWVIQNFSIPLRDKVPECNDCEPENIYKIKILSNKT